MPYDLTDDFTRVLQNASETGGNHYLTLLSSLVSDIHSHENVELDDAKQRLHDLLSDEQMALDGVLSTQFINELGEAHFYVLASRASFSLKKIPESNKRKTPDFKFLPDAGIYFEVKTPSITEGEIAMRRAIEESWQGQLDLEAQIDDGIRIAHITQEFDPYGPEPCGKRLTHMINVLQKKIGNNLKPGQFSDGPTYLVCSLLSLRPYDTDSDGIFRPVFRRVSGKMEHYISGQLWMSAFSEPGMLVHKEAQFEGARALEGSIDQTGILVGNTYDFVKGIIFVIYDTNGESRMGCLVRSHDDLEEPLFKLIGNRWNDQHDSNGWELTK